MAENMSLVYENIEKEMSKYSKKYKDYDKKDFTCFKEIKKTINNSSIPTKEEIIEELKKVQDPELFFDVYTLGFIYDIIIDDNNIIIIMTLTSPACFAAQVLPEEVVDVVSKLENVEKCGLILTFEPQWIPDLMDENVRIGFGF